jgi:trehalose 6-phosphate phosphatase
MAVPHPLPEPSDAWALFLDVDGTLIEIADAPDAVSVEPAMIGVLDRLDRRLGHAIALVSGRELATLDRLFAPLRLTAAGLHGLERRTPDGRIERSNGAAGRIEEVRNQLSDFAASDDRLLVEDKGMTAALHYRRAPDRAEDVLDFAGRLANDVEKSLILQRGKMVVEFRPRGPNKGDIVDRFMEQAPFAGRLPVFIGDDVTDEDGFAAVNRRHGHSIRVGPEAKTEARWRIDGVAELCNWLASLAERCPTHSPDTAQEPT